MIHADFATELRARWGSPLYVYDLEKVEARVRDLRDCLPSGARILYSLKANPLPGLVRIIQELGLDAEVASLGELQTVLDAGFDSQRIQFGGPGKGIEIGPALDAGVRYFSCESRHDVDALRNAAHARRLRPQFLLRLNPPNTSRAGLAMSGVSSQFGLDGDLLEALARDVLSDSGPARMIGLHLYQGTQMADPDALGQAARTCLDWAERIYRDHGSPPDVLNFGGGFPWPFGRLAPGPDLERTRQVLNEALASLPRSTRSWFESGRFLTASAGTLLTTVIDIKISRGRRFVVVDSGIHQLAGMAGLGRIHRPRLHFERLTGRAHASDEPVPTDVVGPLCTPLDTLARGISLPADLRPGDLLAVPNVGAYGLTASLVAFLSRMPPTEILYRGEQVEQIFRLRHGHQDVALKEVLQHA